MAITFCIVEVTQLLNYRRPVDASAQGPFHFMTTSKGSVTDQGMLYIDYCNLPRMLFGTFDIFH